jgi:hypothetical protein
MPTPPARPGRRAGLVAFAVTAGWLYALSGLVGCEPGRPVGERIDAYFQNDAGGRIADAVAGTNARAAVVHPLYYFLVTLPVHLLTKVLAGIAAPPVTALHACRAVAAAAAGLGVGRLTAAVVRFGVPPVHLAACAPLFLFGTAQTLAALPDHFALSLGVLTAAFAVFLDDRGGYVRHAGWKLAALAALAGGVTVTNAVFPAGLLAWRWVAARGRVPRWVWPPVGVGVVAAVAFGWWVSRFDPTDHSNPLVWRVRGYLSGRVLSDPAGAAARAFRGPVDVTVGPTPVVDTNNYHRHPMLTYEPTTGGYPAWPYDRVQGVAAAVWLGLLAGGIPRGLADGRTRWPAAVLLGWAAGNVAFHILWGDEFFLYTPHYSWAVAAVAAVGLRGLPLRATLPAVAVVAVGQVWTLLRIREVLATLPG